MRPARARLTHAPIGPQPWVPQGPHYWMNKCNQTLCTIDWIRHPGLNEFTIVPHHIGMSYANIAADVAQQYRHACKKTTTYKHLINPLHSEANCSCQRQPIF